MHYTTFSIKSWIPVSRTGMTPFVVNSLLLYGLAATLNGYRLTTLPHVFSMIIFLDYLSTLFAVLLNEYTEAIKTI
ncbi:MULTISPECIES: hypothetical protein [unclassified Wolbachia]|uniref:hypothetical protein n=1 Tax=unclassified Wolbachia TaxID=2640676 RepID=UPI001428D15C|nr:MULTISPECIES: hypothetical protein [unclassified Wolbachia]